MNETSIEVQQDFSPVHVSVPYRPKVSHIGSSEEGSSQAVAERMRSDERALLIDTRRSAYSWKPEWRKEWLLSTYGDRYRPAGHVLGNLRYRTKGEIAIADLARGVKGLCSLIRKGFSLILLCECRHLGCHRYVILDAFHTAMPEVPIEKLIPSPAPGSSFPCLCIQPPWIEFILAGVKDVENRTWKPSEIYRGKQILLHAGKKFDLECFYSLRDKDHPGELVSFLAQQRHSSIPLHRKEYVTGAILGVATLSDIAASSESPWYRSGQFAWTFTNARRFSSPIPYPGSLGIFEVPASVVAAEMERA